MFAISAGREMCVQVKRQRKSTRGELRWVTDTAQSSLSAPLFVLVGAAAAATSAKIQYHFLRRSGSRSPACSDGADPRWISRRERLQFARQQDHRHASRISGSSLSFFY